MNNAGKTGDVFHPRTAFLFALIIAAIMASIDLAGAYARNSLDLLSDPDSNMRMQQVRDLLAGQSWFDVRMTRFGLEGYTPMHWPRLADIVPAGFIWALTPLIGREMAEVVTVTSVPMLYRVPLFFVCIWAAHRIVPSVTTRVVGLAALVLLIQLPFLHIHFRPGLIDHHNLQMIALAVLIGGFVGIRTLKSGVIAAVGLVFGLVIGFDAVPYVASAILALGLLWVFDPQAEQRFLKGFGYGTLALTALCAPIFIPQPWTNVWCDSWTVPVAAILFSSGGIAVLMATWLGNLPHWWQRLFAAILVGGGVLAGLVLLFPACLNPLPLQDPLIDKYWMSGITENSSLSKLVGASGSVVFIWLLPIVALIYFVYSIWLGRLTLKATLPALGMVAVGLLFSAAVSRGIPMLSLATALILTPLLAQVFSQAKSHKFAILFVCASLVFAAGSTIKSIVMPDKTWVTLVDGVRIPEETDAAFCLKPEDVAALRRLPPGLMIAPFGPSEFILRQTLHRTSFAGYHRAKEDNLWVIRWLIAQPEVAKSMLNEHHPRYVFTCKFDTHFKFMAESDPSSFVARLVQDKPPGWVKPVAELSGGGRVYEIFPTE